MGLRNRSRPGLNRRVVIEEAAVVAAQVGRPLRSQVRVLGRVPPRIAGGGRGPPAARRRHPVPDQVLVELPAGGPQNRPPRSGGRGPGDMDRAEPPRTLGSASLSPRRMAGTPPNVMPLVPADALHRPAEGVGGSSRSSASTPTTPTMPRATRTRSARWTRLEIEPLDCPIPCVAERGDGEVTLNPDWSEPPS